MVDLRELPDGVTRRALEKQVRMASKMMRNLDAITGCQWRLDVFKSVILRELRRPLQNVSISLSYLRAIGYTHYSD